jgi:hypothetical protein
LERLLQRMLFISCLAATPFVLKRKNFLMHLTVFFAKGVITTLMDSIFIKRKLIAYPVRPFPKIYDINILYDLLFYPLLSVIWVRWSYNTKLSTTILRSLFFSVPMSFAQWIMEKKTNLFHWKSWTIFHTFAWINCTLFTIRGMVEIIKMMIRNRDFVNNNLTLKKDKAINSQLFENFPIPFNKNENEIEYKHR